MQLKQGDVYFADLSPVYGSEQGGVRPVVIVQNDIGNKFAPTVIVAAVTAQISEAKLPTHVEMSSNKYPIVKDSVILLEQIRTIDKARLTDKICTLEKNDLRKVLEAWNISGGTLEFWETEDFHKYYKYIENKIFEHIEDNEYEFKEIKGGNPWNSIKDTVGDNICSFLNANGGRIIYGITDKVRVIKGFKADSHLLDEIKKVVYDKLNTLSPTITPQNIELLFHQLYSENEEKIKDAYVLEILVHSARDKSIVYFIKGTQLYVRVDGKKQLLQGSAIVDFILSKSK
jgi:mRNA interferase MazF